MKVKSILLPTLALLIICLVVTGALSVTNHFTKDAIARQSQKQITDAMTRLVPGATFTRGTDTTYLGVKDGQTVYIFLTQAMGYKSKVEVMTAMDENGQITGVAVVNCSEESPGIGQKVGTDNGFLAQFTGKSGTLDTIDAITGATYSSDAVKEAVNLAVAQFESMNLVSPTNAKEVPNE